MPLLGKIFEPHVYKLSIPFIFKFISTSEINASTLIGVDELGCKPHKILALEKLEFLKLRNLNFVEISNSFFKFLKFLIN